MILDFSLAKPSMRCYLCDLSARREVYCILVLVGGRVARFAACLQHALAELAPVFHDEHPTRLAA